LGKKKLTIAVVCLLATFSLPTYSFFYIGLGINKKHLSPAIYCTSHFSKWLADNLQRGDAMWYSYYGDVSRDVVNKEKLFSDTFRTKEPEHIIASSWKGLWGATVWFGTWNEIVTENKESKPGETKPAEGGAASGDKAADDAKKEGKKETHAPKQQAVNGIVGGSFYIGLDATISVAPQTIENKLDDYPLISFSKVTFFLRHGFSGKSTFSTDIAFFKRFSAECAIRVGFGFTSHLVGFIRLGLGLNQNVFERFNVKINNDISIVRYDDSTATSTMPKMFEDIPKVVEYKTIPGKQYFALFSLGFGVEYSVWDRAYVRLEYGCKYGLSNKIKFAYSGNEVKIRDAITKNAEIPLEYSLRYHDVVNCVFLGFGVRIG
jgi:hypothetical protein